jgi:hypothetical protein
MMNGGYTFYLSLIIFAWMVEDVIAVRCQYPGSRKSNASTRID